MQTDDVVTGTHVQEAMKVLRKLKREYKIIIIIIIMIIRETRV